MIVVIVVGALAFLLAVISNVLLRPRLMPQDDEGMSVKDLLTPLLTLTVVLLAFTLVTASSSHKKAEEAARVEATAADHLGEAAEYAPEAQRERLQADVICYSRAVVAQEWPRMADGGDASEVVNTWSEDFRATFKSLRDQPSFGMLVAAENERGNARQDRLAESTTAIPDLILWFLMFTMALTVVSLGICLPRRGNKAHLTTLALVTVLLTTTLVIIRDAERPFSGFIDVKATAMSGIEEEALEARRADDDPLPCDEQGTRLSA